MDDRQTDKQMTVSVDSTEKIYGEMLWQERDEREINNLKDERDFSCQYTRVLDTRAQHLTVHLDFDMWKSWQIF